MSTDRIRLLSAYISNQIAAGEVVQRPANVVKELVENAIDAGATNIEVRLMNAGKTSIRVIDNGIGMNENDARLCFEKHATSKIQDVSDLHAIQTMGFRGEALAAICAVCKVSLNTKRTEDNIGTHVRVENSVVLQQQPIACNDGTDIRADNLFFSIPARKNFLKDDTRENLHNYETFVRIALAYPHITFKYCENTRQIFHLQSCENLRLRIKQLFSDKYSDHIIPVEIVSEHIQIHGFIGKPEIAKKKRGEQFFFVNGRFIRQNYFRSAILKGYEGLLGENMQPFYAIYLQIDPQKIDVNIHPTKQEIHFDDERIIYQYLLAAVKQSLGKHAVVPVIDFSLDPQIMQLPTVRAPQSTQTLSSPTVDLARSYATQHKAHMWNIPRSTTIPPPSAPYPHTLAPPPHAPSDLEHEQNMFSAEQWADKPFLQVHHEWVLCEIEYGVLFLHQQRAHEQILSHQYKNKLIHKHHTPPQQPLLFPECVHLSAHKRSALEEMLPTLRELGYHIVHKHDNSFDILAYPSDVPRHNIAEEMEQIVEAYRYYCLEDIQEERQDRIIHCIALRNAIKIGHKLDQEAMTKLVCDFFSLPPERIFTTKRAYMIAEKRQLDSLL